MNMFLRVRGKTKDGNENLINSTAQPGSTNIHVCQVCGEMDDDGLPVAPEDTPQELDQEMVKFEAEIADIKPEQGPDPQEEQGPEYQEEQGYQQEEQGYQQSEEQGYQQHPSRAAGGAPPLRAAGPPVGTHPSRAQQGPPPGFPSRGPPPAAAAQNPRLFQQPPQRQQQPPQQQQPNGQGAGQKRPIAAVSRKQ